MSFDMILGVIVIVAGLGLVVFLTLWGRSVIERIARKDNPSLRTILEDIYHGR